MKKEPGTPVHFSRFPLPGQRILRSVISVWLCIVVYYLRGRRGEPFYSIIAALQCIQPYSSSMLSEGRDRIIGTFIGAFWGAAIVFSELLPIGGSFETALIHYSLLGLLTGLVIYSTVLLKIPQYALFSFLVFLGISMYHLEDANPYIHVFNRTMDTIIGVVIAILVNSAHLPRTRDRQTLFVSGIALYRLDQTDTGHGQGTPLRNQSPPSHHRYGRGCSVQSQFHAIYPDCQNESESGHTGDRFPPQ